MNNVAFYIYCPPFPADDIGVLSRLFLNAAHTHNRKTVLERVCIIVLRLNDQGEFLIKKSDLSIPLRSRHPVTEIIRPVIVRQCSSDKSRLGEVKNTDRAIQIPETILVI